LGRHLRDARENRAAFTLIELLVVVTIICVLAAFLFPTLRNAREKARLIVCTNTLRNILIANLAYASDYNGFIVHGKDIGQGSPGEWVFDQTKVFDDDWCSSTAGNENPYNWAWYYNTHGGDQNICGVGQLMWGKYLPENAAAIACPQADYREQKGSPAYCTSYKQTEIFLTAPSYAWKSDCFSGVNNASYSGCSTTYVVRGPLVRLHQIKATKYALFCDHEQAPNSGTGSGSPLAFWERVHKEGINVGYVDGHVRFFRDKDRSLTYASGYTRYYGNGAGLYSGGYDEP